MLILRNLHVGCDLTGCKESQFYSLPFGQAALAQESLIFQLAPQNFCLLNSLKNFICRLGKLRTEFTSLRSLIAKPTSPGLSDIPFFACCLVRHKVKMSFTVAIIAISQSWLSVNLSLLSSSGTRLLICDPF